MDSNNNDQSSCRRCDCHHRKRFTIDFSANNTVSKFRFGLHCFQCHPSSPTNQRRMVLSALDSLKHIRHCRFPGRWSTRDSKHKRLHAWSTHQYRCEWNCPYCVILGGWFRISSIISADAPVSMLKTDSDFDIISSTCLKQVSMMIYGHLHIL